MLDAADPDRTRMNAEKTGSSILLLTAYICVHLWLSDTSGYHSTKFSSIRSPTRWLFSG